MLFNGSLAGLLQLRAPEVQSCAVKVVQLLLSCKFNNVPGSLSSRFKSCMLWRPLFSRFAFWMRIPRRFMTTLCSITCYRFAYTEGILEQ